MNSRKLQVFNPNNQKTQPNMSAYARQSNQKKRTPFCKFCKDAGKSQSEYTSHYTKDRPGPQGKVVCPTILATKCNYCKKLGHSKSHCSVLKARNNNDKSFQTGRRIRKPMFRPRPPVEAKNSISNWGMATNKEFKTKIDRASRSGRVVSRSATNTNQFESLNGDEKVRRVIVGPKVASANPVVVGAWATKLEIEESTEQVVFKTLREIEEEESDRLYDEELADELGAMATLGPRPASLQRDSTIRWGDEIDEIDEMDGAEYQGAAYTQQDGWYD
jgi:hypothetical protein